VFIPKTTTNKWVVAKPLFTPRVSNCPTPTKPEAREPPAKADPTLATKPRERRVSVVSSVSSQCTKSSVSAPVMQTQTKSNWALMANKQNVVRAPRRCKRSKFELLKTGWYYADFEVVLREKSSTKSRSLLNLYPFTKFHIPADVVVPAGQECVFVKTKVPTFEKRYGWSKETGRTEEHLTGETFCGWISLKDFHRATKSVPRTNRKKQNHRQKRRR